jgi:hypothetical protein
MGKAPKFKNRFLQMSSSAQFPGRWQMTLAKNDQSAPKGPLGWSISNGDVPVL